MTNFTDTATTVGREAAAKVRSFIATNEQAKVAKNAVYTAVGLGVLGVQKINVAAKTAQQKIDATVDTQGISEALKKSGTLATVKRQAAKVDEKVNEVIAAAESALIPYEEKLPKVARDAIAKAHHLSAAGRAKVSTVLQDKDVVTDETVTTA